MSPDGKGLPEGRGTAAEGAGNVRESLRAAATAPRAKAATACALAGGQGTLKSPKPLRTVGSYWPHATTICDYVSRAMPFDKPGTLSRDQVYSLTAYVLFLNGSGAGERRDRRAAPCRKSGCRIATAS